jgi:hypothetical protein
MVGGEGAAFRSDQRLSTRGWVDAVFATVARRCRPHRKQEILAADARGCTLMVFCQAIVGARVIALFTVIANPTES